jgi:redox-sensitive bicupin YhaK (pirin superfamily)
MSIQPSYEPECLATGGGAIELAIEARIRSLGEFDVRRVLPVAKRRNVGPFVFFDHMGPAIFPPGKGIAVRPHPHIGLATVTYLFEGEIMHRDSLGFAQLIQRGAVNLMTAGRGIVHSERASDDLQITSRLHGIQSWMALPVELEEGEPSFVHYPAATLPELEVDGCAVRVIMGSAFVTRFAGREPFAHAVSRGRAPAGARALFCQRDTRRSPPTSSRGSCKSTATITRTG